VDTDQRDRLLAGLVSADAEVLYGRLARLGGLRIGAGPDEVDPDAPAARELLDARVARRSADATDRIIAVTEAAALQLLLARQHGEILARHERIMRGWERLDSVLSLALASRTPTSSAIEPRTEVISDPATINKLSVELYQGACRELLGITLGTGRKPVNEYNLVTPPEQAVRKGIRFRMLYDTRFAAEKVGARIIEASLAAGEEARIRPEIPLKMLHVDDTVALVALTPTGVDGALLVRSPPLLAALRQWFELLWDDDATTTVGGVSEVELTPMQRHVLRLLASGMSDEAVARACGASVRTVRRHMTAIMDALGVNSRFAAGAMAAKRGWI